MKTEGLYGLHRQENNVAIVLIGLKKEVNNVYKEYTGFKRADDIVDKKSKCLKKKELNGLQSKEIKIC